MPTTRLEPKASLDFERVFHEHYSRIFRFFRFKGWQQQDAEDLSQETFRRAYQGRDRLQDDTKLDSWLTGIAIKVSHEQVRAQRTVKRKREELSFDDPKTGVVAEHRADSAASGHGLELALRRDLMNALRTTLDGLPTRMHSCTVLRYFHNKSYDEIANLLGISPGAVGAQLSEAKQRLLAVLEAHSGSTQ